MPLPGLHLWQRARQLYTCDIWRNEYLSGRGPKARFYALLRVISITITGLSETKSASRAAALSFSTLLGLGPLMAIAVLVAGFVLDRQDPDLAVNTLNRLIKFVAPQVTQYERLEAERKARDPSPTPGADSPQGSLPAPRSDVVSAATLNLPPSGPARAREVAALSLIHI